MKFVLKSLAIAIALVGAASEAPANEPPLWRVSADQHLTLEWDYEVKKQTKSKKGKQAWSEVRAVKARLVPEGGPDQFQKWDEY